MNALELVNISKKYPSFLLENINISLPMGKIMGLLGQNGAGKTTLLQVINNEIEADSGQVYVLGKSNKAVSVKQFVGIVTDAIPFPNMWTPISIEKNMGQFYSNWDTKKYHNHLMFFNLEANKKISELSRGMKVKLMISFACAYDAKLLVLDEPTSGLDPVSRRELLIYFKQYVSDGKHSILFSSHITSDLDKVADFVAFLVEGKLCLYSEKSALTDCCIIHGNIEDADRINSEAIYFSIDGHIFSALIKKEKVPESNRFSALPAELDDIMILLDRSYKNEESNQT